MNQKNLLEVDWSKIPAPSDDGAAAHLVGMTIPPLSLMATDDTSVTLSALPGRIVVFAYPRTGEPGKISLVDDWDMIPGSVNFWDLIEMLYYMDHIGWDGWVSYDVNSRQSPPIETMSATIAAVKAAGLVEALSGPGPFTVFAPYNDAFAKLDAAALNAAMADPKGALTNILTYHVAEGDVKAADLTDGQKIDTVEGGQLTVSIDGDTVKINGAKVVTPDVATSNGTVHVIDTVLLPQQ